MKTKEILKKATTDQYTRTAWKGRTTRAIGVFLASLAAVKGIDTAGWSEFGNLLTPSVVLPMLLAVYVAATTSATK